MPFSAFEASFRHGDISRKVRSRLDWSLLERLVRDGGAAIRVRREASPAWAAAHTAYSVWYTDDSGTFADFHHPAAAPIPFHRITRHFGALPSASRATVRSMAAFFEARRGAVLPVTEIVTLELGEGRVVVLDGNHRLAAVFLKRGNRPAPLPVMFVEYRVTAPLSADLLPDLSHHRPTAAPTGAGTDGARPGGGEEAASA
ncbi:hypothetical protein [Nocardiopsis suaedae]|uniref:hypothetical protein n=1 Tax=Nocardiopsis suaedae TaxID=3018444 RepID=UPI0022E39760|nr:hypothetical protein [Nocardiopsis suaedae]